MNQYLPLFSAAPRVQVSVLNLLIFKLFIIFTETATNLTVTEPAPSIIPPIIGSCNDSRYTHKVYLCHDDHGMAIEDTRNNTVQLYNWVQAGVKNIQYMTSNQFYKGNCYINYIGMAMLSKIFY